MPAARAHTAGVRAQARAGAALGLVVFGWTVLALPRAALAQTISQTLLDSEIPDARRAGRNVSVLERPHPEWAAIGIPAGGFTLYPKLETGIGYLSNVFGVANQPTGDAAVLLSPSIFAQSNWGRHELTAEAGANLREFVSQGTENEEGWFVQADGRLDVIDYDTITGGVEVRKLYNERDSGFYPTGAAAALGYMKAGGYLRGTRESGRLRLVGSVDSYDYTYDSVARLGGGVLDQSFNNQNTSRFSVRAEWATTPDAALFGQFTHVIKTFQKTGASDLSSTEERSLVGVALDLTSLIRMSAGVGYVARHYDTGAFKAVSGLAFNGRVEYFLTPLTTLSGSLQRTVEDSLDFGGGGFFDTQLRAAVDNELLRNVLLSAYFKYENDDYSNEPRSDDISEYGVGVSYSLSHLVSIRGDLSHVDRTSSGSAPGPVFEETRLFLTTTLQF